VLGSVTDAPKAVSAIARELGSARQSVQRIADAVEYRRPE
jgi:predicted transcriptional regulator